MSPEIAHDLVGQLRAQRGQEAAPGGLAYQDARIAVGARVLHHQTGHLLAFQAHHLRAQAAGQLEVGQELVLAPVAKLQRAPRLHVQGAPLGLQGESQAPGRTDQAGRVPAGADADQQAVLRRPRRFPLLLGSQDFRFLPHPVGGLAQSQLSQGDQVRFLEEAGHGPAGLVGHVHLAFLEAPQQVLGRDVHQLDLVGLVEYRIRDRLAHRDAGDAGDDVVEAVDVLDVQGGVDGGAPFQKLLHVLPALEVSQARGVAVRQLVHQEDLRPGFQGRF